MSISKKFSKSILSLPLHTFLTKKQVHKICDIINEMLKKKHNYLGGKYNQNSRDY